MSVLFSFRSFPESSHICLGSFVNSFESTAALALRDRCDVVHVVCAILAQVLLLISRTVCSISLWMLLRYDPDEIQIYIIYLPVHRNWIYLCCKKAVDNIFLLCYNYF